VGPGAPAALAGVGQGYELDADATHLVLAGDESALPAIEQLLGVIPHHVAVQVVVELAAPDGRLDLPHHPGATVTWCDDLVQGVRDLDLPDDARVWAGGNAAEVQRIRKYLFDERGLPRQRCVIRGYWK
jgi:NADPH-dependent ferric siderophore reductase